LQDSLWAAEDIEAVFDQDPQRVCILQGPVAVKYATVKDEPIKDLLGNITSNLVQKLLERSYDGDVSNVPTIDYLAPAPEEVDTPEGVTYEETAKSVTYTVGDVIPDTTEWLQTLSGLELSWIKALLTSQTIVQGSAYIDNPLRRALAPRRGQKVVIGMDNGLPTSLTIYGAARSHGIHKPDFKAVEIKYTASSKIIDVKFYEDRRDVSVPLALQFKYVPSAGAMPIQEVAVGRNRRIKDFYWKLWFGDDEEMPEIDIHETFIGPEVTISAQDVEMFCGVVGNQSEAFKTARTEVVKAPLDFAIVTGWQVRTFEASVLFILG
jgi:fatty acid synthase subunit alpha